MSLILVIDSTFFDLILFVGLFWTALLSLDLVLEASDVKVEYYVSGGKYPPTPHIGHSGISYWPSLDSYTT